MTEIKSRSSSFCTKSCQARTQHRTAVAAQLLPSTNRQSCCRHSEPLGKPSWGCLYLAFSSLKPLIKTRGRLW